MLEGKEVEGKLGDVGTYSLDVDAKGKIAINVEVLKDFGHTKVISSNSVETDIFKVAEEVAKKTGTTWDDKAIAALKSALGIK